MEEILKPEWWSEKVEEYLEYASNAEAKGNHPAALLLFRKALFYEAYLRGDMASVGEYAPMNARLA